MRLRALFASAFGRTIRDDFFDRTVARTFIEEGYRGAAIMEPTAVAPYLTKFAVERAAQGEGLGGEIWSLVSRDFPQFYWRSRPDNPITAWYTKNCDGLCRVPELARLLARPSRREHPAAIAHALSLQSDFLS